MQSIKKSPSKKKDVVYSSFRMSPNTRKKFKAILEAKGMTLHGQIMVWVDGEYEKLFKKKLVK